MRMIDAHVAMRKIHEYMANFPNANTRRATCRVILSMLGDENQIPTLSPSNEPLTPEQLREMDGQPVYVVFLPDSATASKFQLWMLVSVNRRGTIRLINNIGGSSIYEDIRVDIEGIYRRSLEEGELHEAADRTPR